MPKIAYTLKIEQDNPYEIAGSFDDPGTVEMIKKQLRDGSEYAWFGACVVATCRDFQEESDWLGACSYESEEDFKASDYYADMRDEARDRLLTTLKNAAELYRELTAQD